MKTISSDEVLVPSLAESVRVKELTVSKSNAFLRTTLPLESTSKFSLPSPERLYVTVSPSGSTAEVSAIIEPTSMFSAKASAVALEVKSRGSLMSLTLIENANSKTSPFSDSIFTLNERSDLTS